MTGYFRCRPTPALSSSLDHEPIWYTEWSSNNSIRASQMHSRTRRGHVANTRQRTQRPVRLSTNHEPVWVLIISTIDLCQQWNLGEAVLAAVFLASQWEAVQLTKVIRTETIAFLHQGNDYSFFSRFFMILSNLILVPEKFLILIWNFLKKWEKQKEDSPINHFFGA